MYEPYLNEKKGEFDWLLLIVTIGLMLVGTAFIFSASQAGGGENQVWYKQYYTRQIFFYVAGIIVALGFCCIQYTTWARWSFVFYGLAVVLLVAVLFIGASRFGAKRWINITSQINLQPSEFAKIAFILVQANFLSRPVEELRQPRVFWQAMLLVALPFALIAKEPDLGSALVLLPVSMVTMYVAGVPRIFLLKLIACGAIFAMLMVSLVLFLPQQYLQRVTFIKSYQQARILTYFGRSPIPKNAPPEVRKEYQRKARDASYQVDQAMISVGSGGMFGKGWRQGTQYSLGFLPQAAAHNDFIFSVIAEEEGFIGSVLILTLYTVLFFCGIKIASQARDRLGKIMAIGVVTLLFSHVFINIGMNIRLMPVTGIPLPLLSYGGSSVVCSLIAIGILHNIHIYRKSY